MKVEIYAQGPIDDVIKNQSPPDINCEYLYKKSIDADFLVVHGLGYKGDISHIPIERRVLNITEDINSYDEVYLNNFGCILSPYPINEFKGIQLVNHAIHPWWINFGKWKFDDYKSLVLKKTKMISVISSDKQGLQGHKTRYNFVESLKARFDGEIDFFGRGSNEIKDKSEGLLDYKYAITIENGFRQNYFSEKMHDPLLSWCLPIYSGCSNTRDYFPVESYISLNIANPCEALDTIQVILDDDPYDAHLDAIKEARDLILHKYNLPVAIHERLKELDSILRKK